MTTRFEGALKQLREMVTHLQEHGFIPNRVSGDEEAAVIAVQQHIAMDLDDISHTLDSCLAEGDISDGFHTMSELYTQRMVYQAMFVNTVYLTESVTMGWPMVKSRKHHDGQLCFGGGWFVVTMNLPTGQVTQHYALRYWDLFHIPAVDTAPVWDGHTAAEGVDRMLRFLGQDEYWHGSMARWLSPWKAMPDDERR